MFDEKKSLKNNNCKIKFYNKKSSFIAIDKRNI